MSTPAEHFAALEAPQKEVNWRGESRTITPIKVGKLPAFARAIGPVFDALPGAGGTINFGALISEHGEAVIEAASLATGIPRAELDDAELDEFMELVAAIIEVNRDFFTRRVQGKVATIASRMTAGDGSTPSKP